MVCTPGVSSRIRIILKDAGIQWKDIQAVAAGIYIWGGNSGNVSGQMLAGVMGETGIPLTNIYNMSATAPLFFGRPIRW